MANAQEIFNTIGKTITQTADKVAKKTDELIYVQKLRGQIRSLKRQMDETYKYMGELMYAKSVAGEEIPADIANLCTEIEMLKAEIKDNKILIAEKKGSNVCPCCGAILPKEASYCMKCGSTIEGADEFGFGDEFFEEDDLDEFEEELSEGEDEIPEAAETETVEPEAEKEEAVEEE